MKLKLNFGITMTAFLAVIVSTSCFTPALASTTYVDYMYYGRAIIEPPGQPKMQIVPIHFYQGDHGTGDALYLFVGSGPSGQVLMGPVVIYTDNLGISNWLKSAFAGLPTVVTLVKDCRIQGCRSGNTLFAYWTVPIVAPSENWYNTLQTPAVTLPPSCMLLIGYGSANTDSSTSTWPSGWTWAENDVYFDACATFVCPQWKYVTHGASFPNPLLIAATVTSSSP
jgi:hypothetical protein